MEGVSAIEPVEEAPAAVVQEPVRPAFAGLSQAPPRRRPAVFGTLLGFALRDFSRSSWVFLVLAALVATHALFFNYNSGRGHFFGIEYAMTALVAGLVTTALFARAHRAETYPILARAVPRPVYSGALFLAAWLIAALTHVVSSAVEWLRFGGLLNGGVAAGGTWRTPAAYLAGSSSVLLVAAFAVCLVALLSTFVSPSAVRLGLLTLLAVLVMSFDNRNFPVEALRPLLQQFPPVLAPVAGALKYATDAQPDSVAVLSVAVLAAYTLLLLLAALFVSSGRELVLD